MVVVARRRDPIKAEECWSSVIREDLRAFTGIRKKAWLDLIGNMTFAVGDKAPAKWIKAAETALSAVGPKDFGDQVRRWLSPMAPPENAKPLRITTPGRDLLGCLIWDSLLCPPDSQLDEALSWIGKATWKNKESRDRMLKIYGPLTDVLSARNPSVAQELEKSAGVSRDEARSEGSGSPSSLGQGDLTGSKVHAHRRAH